jgi:hypothetical protein
VDKRAKIKHYDQNVDRERKEMGNNLEHNAAVDYAIRKSAQRENYFVLELQIQCNDLPNVSKMERATTFAVLYVDINSLDDHDKIVIGGVEDEELNCYEEKSEESKNSINTEDYKPHWQQKKITEYQVEETNPIYELTYSFNSQNSAAMRFKVEIYQRKNKQSDFPLSRPKEKDKDKGKDDAKAKMLEKERELKARREDKPVDITSLKR